MFLAAVKCKTHCGRRVFSYNYLVVLIQHVCVISVFVWKTLFHLDFNVISEKGVELAFLDIWEDLFARFIET